MLERFPADLVKIQLLCFGVHAVEHHIEIFTGKVLLVAVRQVSAARKVHGHYGVSHIQHGKIYGHVRLGPRMRLDVHVFRSEKLLCPFDRDALGSVDELATAVISRVRVSLGVLVRHGRRNGSHYGDRKSVV